jgi:hypothetical protein
VSSKVLALDPGPTETAYIGYDGCRPTMAGILPNDNVRHLLKNSTLMGLHDSLAIEGIASYGMPVGKEVFDTCIWIGRFIEAYGGEHTLVYRPDVKLHLCKSARAKDANVRQALIDKFGGKAAAIGNKKTPGPLYGIKSHAWSALAVAVTYCETTALSELPAERGTT